MEKKEEGARTSVERIKDFTAISLQLYLYHCCRSLLLLYSIRSQKLGIAEKRGGMRGPENVWGSAATVSDDIDET